MVTKRFIFALGCLICSTAIGCASDKEKALEGLEQIKAACTDNDKDLAKKLTDDLRGKNKVFDKAFDAAIDEQRGSVNYCSPLLHNNVTLRLQHGS